MVREVSLDNGLTFTLDDYEGPRSERLVVLLHGFPQSRRMWRSVAPLVAGAGFRVIAIDQRGYSAGAQPKAIKDYGLRELASDIQHIIRKLGYQTAHVVGHDWGGSVGWQLAGRSPEVVNTLTVLSMPHPLALKRSLSSWGQIQKSLYIIPLLCRPLMSRLVRANNGRFAQAWLQAMAMSPENAKEAVELLGRPGVLRSALRWYQALPINAANSSDVGVVQLPVSYIWGVQDAAVSEEAAVLTQQFATDCKFIRAQATHWIVDEDPVLVATEILNRIGA